MFPSLAYLEWIAGRPARATYDLGSSDLRGDATHDGCVPPQLRGLSDPPTEHDLEALVAREYGVSPEQVLVTAGATHANFLATATALDLAREAGRVDSRGQPHVLVEKPGYEPLVGTPAGLDASVDRFTRPAEADYALLPERVSGAVTDRTCQITVTNGHNPSGRKTDRETLVELAQIAAENDARLLVDEVYAPFVHEPKTGPGTAFGGDSVAGEPATVVTGSLTKFHGLGGLCLGWLVADEAFVDRAQSVEWHVPAVAAPSQFLARHALADGESLAERSRELLAENHAALSAFVARRDDLNGFVAPGSTFAFLRHEVANGDAVSEAAWEAGVLVVPGRFFDDATRFRLSLGRDPATMRAGLDTLERVLDDLRRSPSAKS